VVSGFVGLVECALVPIVLADVALFLLFLLVVATAAVLESRLYMAPYAFALWFNLLNCDLDPPPRGTSCKFFHDIYIYLFIYVYKYIYM
jgi:hypothetical protein